MASRAVVCCLSWQWTDTDSYPAVCCDRRSWERACQEGTLVSSTALPALACRMKVKLNLGVLRMKQQLFYHPPLMRHRRITAFHQRTFFPCRVAHFSQHALKALTRGMSTLLQTWKQVALQLSSVSSLKHTQITGTKHSTDCRANILPIHFEAQGPLLRTPPHTHTHLSTSDDHCTPLGAPFAQHSTDQRHRLSHILGNT